MIHNKYYINVAMNIITNSITTIIISFRYLSFEKEMNQLA